MLVSISKYGNSFIIMNSIDYIEYNLFILNFIPDPLYRHIGTSL